MSNIIIDYDSTFIKLESLDELSKISKNNNTKVENKIRFGTAMEFVLK